MSSVALHLSDEDSEDDDRISFLLFHLYALLCIEVYLIYNAVSVSTIQRNDSAIHA